VTDLVSRFEATEADAASSAAAAAAARDAAAAARAARQAAAAESAAARSAAADAAAAAARVAATAAAAAERQVAAAAAAAAAVPAVPFALRPGGAPASVRLVGDWVEWDVARAVALARSDAEAGVWTAEVRLTPGRHQFKYVIDGEWRVDPAKPTVVDGWHENNTVDVE